MTPKERIIELQRALKIAREALHHIANGDFYAADVVAEEALERIHVLTADVPLQGLVGHGEMT